MRTSLLLCVAIIAAQEFCIADPSPPDSAALNDPRNYGDPSFEQVAFKILREETLRLLASDSLLRASDQQWNRARIEAALRLFGNADVRDGWIYDIAKDQVENLGLRNAEAILDTFYRYCRNDEYIAAIKL